MTDSNENTNIRLSEEVRVDLAAEEPAGPAVRRVLRALAGEMRANRTGVLEDEDPRFLHRFRIAIRRTRTIFSELIFLFPAEDYNRLRPELKWISDLTSPVRDLDVFIIRLDGFDNASDAPHRPGSVSELVREGRADAYRPLEEAITSDRYDAFLAEWVELLEEPDEGSGSQDIPGDADQPVLEVASRAIRRAFARVERQSRALLDAGTMSDVALHRLRIACKKVRYLIEAFASLYRPGDIETTLTHLRRLQDVLGDYNDAVLQRSRIERYRAHLTRDEGYTDARPYLDRIDGNLKTIVAQRRAEFVDSMADFVSADNVAEIDRTFSSLETREHVDNP